MKTLNRQPAVVTSAQNRIHHQETRITADKLSAAFQRRWRINQAGGTIARLFRWRVMNYLLLQRLGWQHWVKGRTFWNAPIWVCTGEVVSSGVLAFGYTECALTALMLATVRPGMRIVDVGAHVGYESMLGAELVGNTGRVVAFEPQHQLAKYTERNLAPYPWVRLVRSAVGECMGTVSFQERALALAALSGSHQGTGLQAVKQYTVPVVRLDEALGDDVRPVDFLKCDVEGAEMNVLRGAQNLLREDRPLVVLEAEMPIDGNLRPRIHEFKEFLAPLGYVPVAFEYDASLRTGSIGQVDMGHANIAFVHPSRAEFVSVLQR